MSATNNYHENLPIHWYSAWDYTLNRVKGEGVREFIIQAIETNIINDIDPKVVFEHTIEDYQFNKIKIDELIKEAFKNANLEESNFTIEYIKITEGEYHVKIKKNDSFGQILCEFLHDQDGFVTDVFISKNNIIYGETHKLFFNTLTEYEMIQF